MHELYLTLNLAWIHFTQWHKQLPFLVVVLGYEKQMNSLVYKLCESELSDVSQVVSGLMQCCVLPSFQS